MKLPRDISGEELARFLERDGYEVTRQTGSHLRLISKIRGAEHHPTFGTEEKKVAVRPGESSTVDSTFSAP